MNGDGPWTEYQAARKADGPWTDYQAAPQADGPWTEYQPAAPAEEPSALGAAVRGVGRRLLPMGAGVAAAGYGAELGAPAGAALGGLVAGPPGAAVGGALGGLGGALLGGFGGGTAVDWAQRKLGLVGGPAEEADVRAHPAVTAATDVASMLPFVGPGRAPAAARLLGGAAMGGIEAGRQLLQRQFDPTQLALQTGAGAFLTRPTGLGRALQPAAHNAIAAMGRGALPELGPVADQPAVAPPAGLPGGALPSLAPQMPTQAQPRMPPVQPIRPPQMVAGVPPRPVEAPSPVSSALTQAATAWQRAESDLTSSRAEREAAFKTVEDTRKAATSELTGAPAGPVPSSLGAAAIVEPQGPLTRGEIEKTEDRLHTALGSRPQAYLEAARGNLAAALDRNPGYNPEIGRRIYTQMEDQLLPPGRRAVTGLSPEDQAFHDTEIAPVHKQIAQERQVGKKWRDKLALSDEEDDELRLFGPPRMRKSEAAFIQSANDGTPLSRRQLGDSSMYHGTKYDVLEAPDGRREPVRRGPKTLTMLRNKKVYTPIDEKPVDYETTKVEVDGEPWTFRRGTTNEIEAGEHAEAGRIGPADELYLKDPLIVGHYTLATIRANNAKLEALWELKNSLETKRAIRGASVAPEGWVDPKFPGLAGYKVDSRLAEILGDFTARPKAQTAWQWLEDKSHQLTGTLFWTGGLPHFLNVFAHAPFSAGWQWFNPKFMGRDWVNGFNDVRKGSELYQKVLEKGGPLFFSTTRNQDFARRFMQRVGHEIVRDPVGTGAAAWARQLGLTAKELAKGYSRAMNGGLWFGSDMITMQQIRAHMRVFQGRGMTENQALGHAMQKIHDLPTYRVPSRIWEGPGGREATQFLRYTPVNVFGRYHYSIAESFGRLAKDLAVGDKQTKIEAVGKVAALASLYMAWKGYDAWVQHTSPKDRYGNRLEAGYPGLLGPVKTAEDWITGRNRSGMEVARHLGFSPSPAVQLAAGLYQGQDVFGRDITRPGARFGEKAAQYADYALEQVPILGEVLPRGDTTGALGGFLRPLEMGQLRLRKQPPPGGWGAAAERSPFKGQRDVGPVESWVTGRRMGTKPKRKR